LKVENKKINVKNLYFLSISIASLLILVLIVFYAPSSKIIYHYQYQLILSIFIFICIFGMLAALSPSSCSQLSDFRRDYNSDYKPKFKDYGTSKREFKGHHPECDNFKNHTYNLMGKIYCAGCSGLFLGALIAVIGTLIYYFYGISDENTGRIIFLMGFLFVLISLLQNFLFNLNINLLKFLFNLILVLGSFLILIGITELNGSVFIQSYFLVVVLIWIMARISNSEINHSNICKECGKESTCIYR